MSISLLVGTVVLGLATAVATPVLGAAVGGTPTTSAQLVDRGGARPSAASAAADVVPPTADVLFNDPTGDEVAQDRIGSHIRRAIDATPHHGTIRMAAYSFDRPDIADALLRACTRRQVTVQVVLNDNFV